MNYRNLLWAWEVAKFPSFEGSTGGKNISLYERGTAALAYLKGIRDRLVRNNPNFPDGKDQMKLALRKM